MATRLEHLKNVEEAEPFPATVCTYIEEATEMTGEIIESDGETLTRQVADEMFLHVYSRPLNLKEKQNLQGMGNCLFVMTTGRELNSLKIVGKNSWSVKSSVLVIVTSLCYTSTRLV